MGCHQEEDFSVAQGAQKQESPRSKWGLLLAAKPTRHADGPYAYFVCFCGFVCILLAIGCAYSYGLLFPVLLDEFKEGKAKTAWVGSLAYASGSLFGPMVGFLCDRFNHRKVAVSGGIIASLGLLVTSQAPSLILMYFTFGLTFGFGGCCLFFVTLTIMPRYFIKRRALATGLVLMGPGASLIVMSPVIQALLNITTWRITLIAMAGMMFVTCILSCSFDPNFANDECQIITSMVKHSEYRSSLTGLAPVTQARSSRFCSTLNFSYLRNKEFVIYLIASVVCFCGITVPLVHMARYCQERGIDANRASMMYFCNGVASVIFRVLTGYVCDKKKIHPKWIMQVAVFLAGITTTLTTHFYSYNELLACFVFYGVADGAIISSMNILALSTLLPQQRAQGFGFFHFCVAISLAVGPPFGGFLADLSGSYTLMFYVAGSFHVVAGCIFFLSYCIQDPKAFKEDLTDLIPIENFLIVEKVTVL